eukprot:TRINITY_DN1753_c0_g1_i5.p1 TRINITY_DN1753_c0_g1~~TRINITY_DN1753_c0_g1_i5.p1  ORF type:complete len:299 (-),score=56.03 TRINITY_DN1753_c0_g1_i5:77-973(-)
MRFSFFFFFKQKTAYEISACLVGSEMCIRDRNICISPGCNYYPVTAMIMISDAETDYYHLAIFPDRPQGGSSLNEGEIELMIHRRLVSDDSKGVNERLDEKQNTYDLNNSAEPIHFSVKHIVFLTQSKKPFPKFARIQERIDLPLYGFFTQLPNENYKFYNKKKKPLARCQLRKKKGTSMVPDGLKLYIRIISGKKLSIRIYNSQPVIKQIRLFDKFGNLFLDKLLSSNRCKIKITSFTETNIAGTLSKQQIKQRFARLPWKKTADFITQQNYRKVRILPKGIKTFVLTFKKIKCKKY